MGLDMFLSKKIYIGGQYEHRQVDGTVFITIRGEKVNVSLNEISYIITEAAYWRKSNQIHKWFVDNVQEGKDDCNEYRVPVKKLRELLTLCKKVLRNREEAQELLPPQEGFFFGSTEVNDWYFQDIKDTVKMLTKALKGVKDDDYDTEFYYSSSW